MAFDKLRQLNELRKMRGQALEMQKKLKEVIETLEKGKYKVKARGDQRIDYIEIDGESQQELVKVINEALEKSPKNSC